MTTKKTKKTDKTPYLMTAKHSDPVHEWLAHYTGQYLDVQRARIALNNQITQLTKRHGEDTCFMELFATGQHDGFTAHVERLERVETILGRQIERQVKQHFMDDWIQSTSGIGRLGFGKLLGVTGSWDYYPTVSKVWKMCGMDVRPNGQAPKRQRGVQFVKGRPPEVPKTLAPPAGGWGSAAEGGTAYNPLARVICHQIGESIVKMIGSEPDAKIQRPRSPYRDLYEGKKIEYHGRIPTGPSECVFGQTHKEMSGTIIPCTLKHAHNAAMRYAVKCLIRDMWLEWHKRRGTLV